MILDLKNTPNWTKSLPIIGLAAGIGLAIYQKKDCIGCFLGYGLSGLLIGSAPLAYYSKKAGDEANLENEESKD
jgi:hypothetical protein